MKLEILTLAEAVKFNPEVKTHPIRIDNTFDYISRMYDLIDSNNWTHDSKKSWYGFDDQWPITWKEFSWVDTNDPYFSGTIKEKWSDLKKKYPLMTKESLMGLIESRGRTEDRFTLFSPETARKIYTEFEEHKDEVRQVVISSSKGIYRPSAIGIAMNETYGWGIKGLKEEFPHHRRFVYEIMKKVGEEFRN